MVRRKMPRLPETIGFRSVLVLDNEVRLNVADLSDTTIEFLLKKGLRTYVMDVFAGYDREERSPKLAQLIADKLTKRI